jgi:carotenoid cleavage dioxygenase
LIPTQCLAKFQPAHAAASTFCLIESFSAVDADPNDDRYQNPKSAYLSNNFAPVRKEVEQENLTVLEGSIPVDLDGMYIRNGSNPQFDPIEFVDVAFQPSANINSLTFLKPPRSYHWFQGDGMLHGVRIHNGTADYINRWVRTDVFEKEKAVGGPYFYSFLSTDTSSFSFLPRFAL